MPVWSWSFYSALSKANKATFNFPATNTLNSHCAENQRCLPHNDLLMLSGFDKIQGWHNSRLPQSPSYHQGSIHPALKPIEESCCCVNWTILGLVHHELAVKFYYQIWAPVDSGFNCFLLQRPPPCQHSKLQGEQCNDWQQLKQAFLVRWWYFCFANCTTMDETVPSA